jgi:hypothetical protein
MTTQHGVHTSIMASAPVVLFGEKQKKNRENVCIANVAVFEGTCANPCDTVCTRDYVLLLLCMYSAFVPQRWFCKNVCKCVESAIQHGVDMLPGKKG